MDRKEIEQRVINLLADYSGEKDTPISLDSRLQEDLNLDSLDRAETIMRLEEEFKVNFGENERPYASVREVVTEVENLLTDKKPTIPIKSKPKITSLETLRVDKSDVERANFNPYYREVESGLGRRIVIGGRKLINLGSNDYLGIANCKELKKAASEALEKYGLSMCGTPIVIGHTDLNRALEKKLAEFLGTEDALVFPSGYQANIGIFQTLTKKEDIIIADKFAHSSLHSGISLSPAKKRLFNHNDLGDLERILEKSGEFGERFIVIEGLYSTEGDTTPLKGMLDLSRKYNAFVVLDDAHGIGVLGSKGRGIIESTDSIGKVDLITGSLGKAIGCFGGFIATSSEVTEILRYRMGSFIYSTALPPAICAASLRSLEMVEKAQKTREKIGKNKNRLYDALNELGYNLTPSSTPLFSVIAGTNYETAILARNLNEVGVYGTPFMVPSVPEGRALIRFIPNADLTEEDLAETVEAFKEIKYKK
jgi:8-amino-7-oxononanoate synthase/acyl carrier protein